MTHDSRAILNPAHPRVLHLEPAAGPGRWLPQLHDRISDMKTYVLSFADSMKHVPEHPERTAMKSLDWDVRHQVWTSRAAMLKTIDMQGKRSSRRDDWRACKIPAKES